MSSKVACFLAALWLPALLWCYQNSSGISARTLYYQGQPDDDPVPPKERAQPASGPKTPPQTSPGVKPTHNRQIATAQPQPAPRVPNVNFTPAVQHLGLRYNILLLDRSTRKGMPIEADRVFQPDDCIQLDLTPNRSGYLYVFEQGSSGKWQMLLPSALMPDELNVVKSRTAVRVPANYCFRLGSPAGEERFFVVLSRNVEDAYRLDQAIRSGSTSGATPAEQGPAPVVETQNNLATAVNHMKSELSSRDISIERVGDPEQAHEPRGSVYLVDASNLPSDRLVTEIVIRHR